MCGGVPSYKISTGGIFRGKLPQSILGYRPVAGSISPQLFVNFKFFFCPLGRAKNFWPLIWSLDSPPSLLHITVHIVQYSSPSSPCAPPCIVAMSDTINISIIALSTTRPRCPTSKRLCGPLTETGRWGSHWSLIQWCYYAAWPSDHRWSSARYKVGQWWGRGATTEKWLGVIRTPRASYGSIWWSDDVCRLPQMFVDTGSGGIGSHVLSHDCWWVYIELREVHVSHEKNMDSGVVVYGILCNKDLRAGLQENS